MRVNDIGESMEVCKYHKHGFAALEKYKNAEGMIYFNDGDSLVIVSRIADEVLKAVKAEREACAEIASYCGCCQIDERIRSRSDTESE